MRPVLLVAVVIAALALGLAVASALEGGAMQPDECTATGSCAPPVGPGDPRAASQPVLQVVNLSPQTPHDEQHVAEVGPPSSRSRGQVELRLSSDLPTARQQVTAWLLAHHPDWHTIWFPPEGQIRALYATPQR